MQDKLFEFSIITPTKVIYQGKVSSLVVPAEFGYLGVLADHAPLAVNTVEGRVTFKKESKETAVIDSKSRGFLEVLHNKVILLLTQILQ